MTDIIFYSLAFLCPLLWSCSNIFDQLLINKHKISSPVLLFFAGVVPTLLLPVTPFVSLSWPGENLLVFAALIAILRICYVYPFFKALAVENTSIVIALFFLGDALIPIAAYLTLNEKLGVYQYAGFILILVSSVYVSYQKLDHKVRRSALFYMIISSIFYAAMEIMRKNALNQGIAWQDLYTWSNVAITCLLLYIPFKNKYRKEILYCLRPRHKAFKLLICERFFSITALFLGYYVLANMPLTVMKGIESLQPFFVLALAVIFGRIFPDIFYEDVTKEHIIKKLVCFTLALIGAVLIVY